MIFFDLLRIQGKKLVYDHVIVTGRLIVVKMFPVGD